MIKITKHYESNESVDGHPAGEYEAALIFELEGNKDAQLTLWWEDRDSFQFIDYAEDIFIRWPTAENLEAMAEIMKAAAEHVRSLQEPEPKPLIITKDEARLTQILDILANRSEPIFDPDFTWLEGKHEGF